MATFGATACFAVNAVSYVPFIGVALWILPLWTPEPERIDSTRRRHMLAGFTDILGQRHVRGALLTVFSTGLLCAPLLTFSPVLVKDVFHGEVAHFSTAVAAFGVGGLLGSAGLLGIAPSFDRRRLSSGAAITFGAVLVLTAKNPWFWGMPALLVVAGASMTVSNIAANSVLQATAKSHLLGQTVSLFMLAMRGGISLGALLTGAAVGLLGVQRALLLDGLIALIVQALLARAWLRAALPDPGSV